MGCGCPRCVGGRVKERRNGECGRVVYFVQKKSKRKKKKERNKKDTEKEDKSGGHMLEFGQLVRTRVALR